MRPIHSKPITTTSRLIIKQDKKSPAHQFVRAYKRTTKGMLGGYSWKTMAKKMANNGKILELVNQLQKQKETAK